MSWLLPERRPGTVVFVSVPAVTDLRGLDVIASMQEREGLTLVLPEAQARDRDFPVLFRAAWITLNLDSDLDAVGLTARFARALADAGIACNVIAGAHHDHLFVPVDRADDTMLLVRSLDR